MDEIVCRVLEKDWISAWSIVWGSAVIGFHGFPSLVIIVFPALYGLVQVFWAGVRIPFGLSAQG